jgi:hypothetical protein
MYEEHWLPMNKTKRPNGLARYFQSHPRISIALTGFALAYLALRMAQEIASYLNHDTWQNGVLAWLQTGVFLWCALEGVRATAGAAMRDNEGSVADD